MIVARVVGELVATAKHDSHAGLKLLLVAPEPLAGATAQGAPAAALIAVDAVGAGVGERVLVVLDGFAAMSAVDRPRSPTDAAIIGIVDELTLAAAAGEQRGS